MARVNEFQGNGHMLNKTLTVQKQTLKVPKKMCNPNVSRIAFQSQFPEKAINELMILTVTQKMKNDMTIWSEEVENERVAEPVWLSG